ncbi:uncharacterized protein [Antedon mediterranea]|uniref:uncharacterized protein n=1 Tax=Antedon mediterranea TaxID=105859 RepID=UPI003AF970B5
MYQPIPPGKAKKIKFFKSGDSNFGGLQLAVSKRKYGSFDGLLNDLTTKVSLPYGVRTIHTPGGIHGVHSLEDFEDGKSYVVSSSRKKKPMDLGRVHKPRAWHNSRLMSPQESILKGSPTRSLSPRSSPDRTDGKQDQSPTRLPRTPKKIMVMRNGDVHTKHMMLMNRRTAQSFEDVLADISDIFKTPVKKLYSSEGMKIESLSGLFNGPELFVAAKLNEKFKSQNYIDNSPFKYGRPRNKLRRKSEDFTDQPPAKISKKSRGRWKVSVYTNDNPASSTDASVSLTGGRWKVSVYTNDNPAASTDASVSLTVYGNKGKTDDFNLIPDEGKFESASVEEFNIQVGNIGNIYKIRICQDDSTEFAGWLCDQIRMEDAQTNELLAFPCQRWMSREEDDNEVCRELPVMKDGHPLFPVVVYKVDVFTGNYWNAGTEANVYLTIIGNHGDTGHRLLYKSKNKKKFEKGKSDTFNVEAVALGNLKKIIIGHDTTDSGCGWFLDKVVINDSLHSSQESIFPCFSWLDGGIGDGKVVRELVTDNKPPNMEKEMNFVVCLMWFDAFILNFVVCLMWFDAFILNFVVCLMWFDAFILNFVVCLMWFDAFILNFVVCLMWFDAFILNFVMCLMWFDAFILNFVVCLMWFDAFILNFVVCLMWFDAFILNFVMCLMWFYAFILNFVMCLMWFDAFILMCLMWLDAFILNFVICLMWFDAFILNFVVCLMWLDAFIWEMDKWKFKRGSQLVFFSKGTGKAVKLKADGSVEASGDINDKDESTYFEAEKVRNNIYTFKSVAFPEHYLCIETNRISGHGKGGINCEFKIRIQEDRTVILEATAKGSSQIATFLQSGKPGDSRGPSIGPSRKLHCYVKGAFREDGIVLFYTSRTQVLSIDNNGECIATGEKSEDAYWRVHKVNVGGVRMFESIQWPKHFLQVKNGYCNAQGSGDDCCHFVVTKYKDKGFVTLTSMDAKGQCVGFLPDGVTKPTVDTGESNVRLYAEVIQFGKPKCILEDETPITKPTLDSILTSVTPAEPALPGSSTPSPSIPTFPEIEEQEIELLQMERTLTPVKEEKKPSPISAKKDTLTPVLIDESKPLEKEKTPTPEPTPTPLKERSPTPVKEETPTPEPTPTPLKERSPTPVKEETPKPPTPLKERTLTPVKEETPTPLKERTPTPVKEETPKPLTPLKERTPTPVEEETPKPPTPLKERTPTPVEEETPTPQIPQRIPTPPPAPPVRVMIPVILKRKKELTPLVEEEDLAAGAKRMPTPHPATPHPATPVEEFEDGDWKVYVKTGKIATNEMVTLTVYGDKGISKPFQLGSGGELFQVDKEDEFKVNLLDIGEIYKIRIGLESENKNATWQLSQVKLKNMKTNEHLFFKFKNHIFSILEADGDLWRELPAVRPGKKPLQVHKYVVEVHTGVEPGSDTDSNVYINIVGEKGDIGNRLLHHSNMEEKFQEGQIDVFELQAVTVMKPTKVIVGHDGKGAGTGWYLHKVVIRESSDSKTEFIFTCNRWLDEGQDDNAIERELELTEIKSIKATDWQIFVTTGSNADSGRNSTVTLHVYGDKGMDECMLLPDHGSGFQPGTTQDFRVNLCDCGNPYKIRIGYDNWKSEDSWYLKTVKMVNLLSDTKLNFEFDRWLSKEHDDLDTWRELPVLIPPNKPLPITKYYIMVWTGSNEEAETNANVFLNIHGKYGDTGYRHLYKSKNNDNIFRSGQMDVFEIEAVWLGKISKAVLLHDGKSPDVGWFVDKVIIKESKTAKNEVYFPCRKWFDVGKGDKKVSRELFPGKPATTPKPISQEEVEVGTTTAIVKWRKPAGDVTGYCVKCTPAKIDKPIIDIRNPSLTQAEFTGLNPGYEYSFDIISLNEDLKGDTVTINATTKPNPAIGGEIKASFRSISVTWDAPDEGNWTGYKVKLTPADSKNSTLKLDVTKRSVEFQGLTPGKKYRVEIMVLCDDIESDKLVLRETTKIPDVVLLPVLDAVSVATTHSIEVSWKQPEGNMNGYQLKLKPPDGDDPEQTISTPACTEATFTGLSPGKVYEIDIVTVFDFKKSDIVKLDARTKSMSDQVRDPKTDSTRRTIVVGWKKPEQNCEGYRLTITPGDAEQNEVIIKDADEVKTSFNNLAPGREYTIAIFTTNGDVESEPVQVIKHTKPHEVLNAASEATAKSITVNWDRPSGELTGYKVICLPLISGPKPSNRSNSDLTKKQLTGVKYERSNTEISSSDKRKNSRAGERTKEDRKKSDAGDRSKSRTGDRSKSRTGDRSKSRTGDRSKSRTGDRSKSRTGDRSKSRTGDRSKSRTGDRSKTDEKSKNKLDSKGGSRRGSIASVGLNEKQPITVYVDEKTTRAKISNLEGGCHYIIDIFTIAGEQESKSINLKQRTKPDVVQNAKVQQVSNSLILSWNPPDGKCTNYQVNLTSSGSDDSEIRILDPDKAMIKFSELQFEQEYTTNIFTLVEDVQSEPVVFTNKVMSLEKPMAVIEAKTETTLNTIVVTWKKPNGNYTGFKVVCVMADNKEAKPIEKVVASDVFKAEYGDLEPGKEYDIQIWSLDKDVLSEQVKLKDKTKSDKPETQGEWKVVVNTCKDSKPVGNGLIHLVVYGKDNKSKQILLTEETEHNLFEAGATDEFEVNVGDIVEIYKIRIGMEEERCWEGWHVHDISMVDKHTEEKLIFNFDRWLSRYQDDFDIVRELPAIRENQDVLPVNVYLVKLDVGDHLACYTDANVWITLHGERGDSGRRLLYNALEKPTSKFMKSQRNTFKVEAVNLGEIKMVQVSHDAIGYGSGMFIEHFEIKKSTDAKEEYYFQCNEWLDDHVGERKTEMNFKLFGVRPVFKEELKEDKPDSKGTWKVTVRTSEYADAGTSAKVYLTICGVKGDSDPLHLDIDEFVPNGHASVKVDAGDIGEVQKVRLTHDNSGDNPNWHVNEIMIEDELSKDAYKFRFDSWLTYDKQGFDVLEMPVLLPDVEPPQVFMYELRTITNKEEDADTDGNVSVIMYGEFGNTGKRTLVKSNKETPFMYGQEDTFLINSVSLGKLEKMVFYFQTDVDQEAWLLDYATVRENKISLTETRFPCHDWLGLNPTTGNAIFEKELVVEGEQFVEINEGDEEKPVDDGESNSTGKWLVWVTTGREDNMGTDANVTIQVYGREGSSCILPLIEEHTNEDDKDTDNEEIKEDENNSKTEDEKDDENKTEEDKNDDENKNEEDKNNDENKNEEDKNDDENKNEEKDDENRNEEDDENKNDDKFEKDGEENKADVQQTTSTDCKKASRFPPGSVKQFEIDVGEIGSLYKIRIAHDNSEHDPDWFIEKIKMKDKDTHQEFHFFANRWLKEDKNIHTLNKEEKGTLDEETKEIENKDQSSVNGTKDDPAKANKQEDNMDVICDTCLELAAIRPDATIPLVKKYIVAIKTGNRGASWTDASPFIVIYGEKGDSGKRQLNRLHIPSSPEKHNFYKNQVNMFSIEAVDLMRPNKLLLGHNAKGYGAGWFVEEINIKEDIHSQTQFVFPCQRWFDDGVEDGKLEREIMLLGEVECNDNSTSKGNWKVSVRTNMKSSDDMSSPVTLIVYDSRGQYSCHAFLKGEEKDKKLFDPGTEDNFKINVGNIGTISKVRVEVNQSPIDPKLYVEWIKMVNDQTDENLKFNFDSRIKMSKEAAVVRGDTIVKQVLIYKVQCHTGDKENAGTEATQIYLTIMGSNGDTGRRLLMDSNNFEMFKKDQVDNFEIEAVSVGKIHTIKVENEHNDPWLLEQVIIKQEDENKVIRFDCSSWIGEDQQDADNDSENELIEPIKSFFAQENWKCFVTTSDINDCGMDKEVQLIAYGQNGKSNTMLLENGNNDNYQRGKTAEFKVNPGTWFGDLVKIRVAVIDIDESGEQTVNQTVSWHLNKVEILDEGSDKKHIFEFNKWFSKTEEKSDVINELPALIKNNNPLPLVEYKLTFHTGYDKQSATDSNVLVTIFGSNGDTGSRQLLTTIDGGDQFDKPDKNDSFLFEAVTVGKIKHVLIEKGPGKPWQLEKLIVKEGQYSNEEMIFKCNKWIGSSELPEDNSNIYLEEYQVQSSLFVDTEIVEAKPQTNGNWKLIVTTGESSELKEIGKMTLTVIGTESCSEAEMLGQDRQTKFQPGTTDEFDVLLNNIGRIWKLRLQLDEESSKSWFVEKIKMKDQDTNEEFSARLNKWVGVNSGNILEIPAIWPELEEPQVIEYKIEVKTGNEEGSDQTENAYVTIYGDKGDTGKRYFFNNLEDQSKFQKDQTDTFIIEAVSVGDLTKCVIGHDGKAWLLSNVKITNDSTKEYVFQCNKWLTANDGDKAEQLLTIEAVQEDDKESAEDTDKKSDKDDQNDDEKEDDDKNNDDENKDDDDEDGKNSDDDKNGDDDAKNGDDDGKDDKDNGNNDN